MYVLVILNLGVIIFLGVLYCLRSVEVFMYVCMLFVFFLDIRNVKFERFYCLVFCFGCFLLVDMRLVRKKLGVKDWEI